jgi:hypothetical protein
MSDPAAPSSSPSPAGDIALPSPGVEPNLHMIAETSKAIHEQVRFADAKASFIAAPNVVLFGYMANQADKLLAVGAADRHVAFWLAVVLVVAYAATAVVSLTYVVLVVMPRHVSLGADGRTHFGHVVQQYGTDLGRYRQDLMAMSTAAWARDLAGQVMEVSHIAYRKHSLIRRASIWTAWSLATWVTAVVAVTVAR